MVTADQTRHWVAQRHAGQSVVAIARLAGVAAATVARVTNPHGPYTPLVGPPGDRVEREVRVARWVARRRAGESLKSIAATDHAGHRTIATATAPWGPYPPPRRARTYTDDQQWRWTRLRRAGHACARIAASENVPVRTVRAATQTSGPYPRPRARSVDLLSLHDLVQLTGIRAPSVYGWWTRDLLPDPTTTDGHGRPLWDRPVLKAWCDQHLHTCASCGARALNLNQHATHRHPGEGPTA